MVIKAITFIYTSVIITFRLILRILSALLYDRKHFIVEWFSSHTLSIRPLDWDFIDYFTPICFITSLVIVISFWVLWCQFWYIQSRSWFIVLVHFKYASPITGILVLPYILLQIFSNRCFHVGTILIWFIVITFIMGWVLDVIIFLTLTYMCFFNIKGTPTFLRFSQVMHHSRIQTSFKQNFYRLSHHNYYFLKICKSFSIFPFSTQKTKNTTNLQTYPIREHSCYIMQNHCLSSKLFTI